MPELLTEGAPPLLPSPTGPGAPSSYQPPSSSGGGEAQPGARGAWARELTAKLRRQWRLVALATGVTMVSAVAITAWLPRTYQSTATIRIDDRARTLPALDALRGLDQESDVGAEMAELSSRSVAEEVADSLALRVTASARGGRRGDALLARGALLRVLGATRDDDTLAFRLTRRGDGSYVVRAMPRGDSIATARPGVPVHAGEITFAVVPGAAERAPVIDVAVIAFDDAVDAMRKRLRVVRPARESNLVTVSYTSHDPLMARDVPNAVVTRFIDRRLSARQAETRATARFLRDQVDRMSGQLATAEEKLRDFRERANVVDLPEQGRAEVGGVAQLAAQRNVTDAERASLAKLLESAQAADRAGRDPAAPSPYRALVAFPTLFRNRAASELLASLAAAEDRRAELLTRRTPVDPDVQQVTTRVHELEEQLRTLTTTYLSGLTNEVGALDSTLSTSRRELSRYPATQLQLARLERNASRIAEVSTLLQTRLKEAEIAESAGDASVRFTDPAALPRRPASPKPLLNLVLAAITGLGLGVAMALAREAVDRRVRTRAQLQSLTGTAVLGLVPRVRAHALPGSRHLRLGSGAGRRALRSPGPDAVDASWPVIVAFQRIATNIAFARRDDSVRVLLLTSPLPGEGKTTVSANGAITMARAGRRVVLVDADLRRAMLHSLFGIQRSPGLAEVLREERPLAACCRRVDAGGAGTLDVLPAGLASDDPTATLTPGAVQRTLERLREAYDLVIIDSSPINVVADAALLATHADGVILVARAGVTTGADVAFAMEQLWQVGAPLLGTVLNDIDLERDASYDGAYRYYGSKSAYSTASAG
ncbi:MAG TPA: polysaccharide biosynthesis tyrosine autokinase [Gemmatimonadaceae bacterium]|nr:polysaccharide biosynthesis tyrosine autokinase [Gemmatimonadaceae bacterium]